MMTHIWKIFLALFLVCGYFTPCVMAQEKLGMANSNYWSTHSIFLNPASSVDSKTYAQLNLIGLNAFGMTNAAYLPKFWVFKPYVSGFNESNIRLRQFAYANGNVDGLSFVISKRSYGAGIFIRGRSTAMLRAGSYRLLNSLLNLDDVKAGAYEVNERNVGLSSMSWLEIGGNFGYMIYRKRNTLISMAGNLRYLSGLNLTYGNINRLKGFTNDTMISIETFSGRLRYTDFAFRNGRGAGLDIGFTFKHMLEPAENYYAHSERNNCKYIDYKYKIGVVLRDFGYMRFKRNTTQADVSGSGDFYGNDNNYGAVIRSLSTSSSTGRPIMASLPTAMVCQFDWNFENKIYLNLTTIQNLVPSRITGAQAPNLLCVAPRFELQNFEVSLPLTLQRYVYPHLGLGLRYRTFVLGFDNVLPIMFRKNTYSLGVYISVGVSLFKNPACKVPSRSVDSCSPAERRKIRKAKHKIEKSSKPRKPKKIKH